MSNPPASPSGFSRFFAELKRRHVVRFALGYAAVAFVLLQLAEIIFPAFGLGDTKLRILVVAVALLFPPALVLAWVFDITSQGIERTPNAGPPDARPAALLPRLALLGVTVAVVGSLGLWLVREGVLDVPVVEADRAGPEDVALVAYDAEAPIRSLAVLPLDDFSGDGAQDYFTAGLQEELIAQLSQIGGLRVVSRTSVQRYAGGEIAIPRIGRDLRVDGVIEGSVRRSGDQVRITLQLIHAASDTHVWTQQYDRSLDNVLALQSDVALDIARQIQADLTPEETTLLQQVASRSVEPTAQDAYLRGRWEAEKGTPEGLAAAKELLETAVQEDSSFAPALVKLAGTRILLGLADTTHQDEEFAKAMEEARKAVAMDSTSQEAWDVIRLVTQRLPDLPSRETARRQAIPTPGTPTPTPAAPDTAWFQSMTHLGRQIETQLWARRGDMERAGVEGRVTGARGLMAAGRFDDAARMLSSALESAPELDHAWEMLVRAHVSAGDLRAAAGTLERWAARGGGGAPDPAEARSVRAGISREGATAYWRWALARLEAQRTGGEGVSLVDLAAARAGTGDTEGALQALQEAVERRDRVLFLLQNDPVWDALRADPRFADVIRRSRSPQGGGRGTPPPRF